MFIAESIGTVNEEKIFYYNFLKKNSSTVYLHKTPKRPTFLLHDQHRE